MAGLAWFLALVLAASAAQKLIERDRMALATAKLAGVSLPVAGPVSLVAAAIEAMAAVALLFQPTQVIGAALAGALWLAYGTALAAAARRGDSLDCGCSFAARTRPVDAFTVLRAFVLAGLAMLALAAVVVGATPPGAAVAGAMAPGIEPLFAALGLFTLYHAAGEIAALPPLHRKAAR